MHNYKTRRRIEFPGSVRFLTFSCFHALPLFGNDAIKDAFVTCLATKCESSRVLLTAWVVMPEHVHLVVVPAGPASAADFLRNLKGAFANQVLRRWRELDAPILQRLGEKPRFWQRGGGYDRNICSVDALKEKVDYIHRNPVSRGLVETAVDWRWSSARWYAGERDPEMPTIACIFGSRENGQVEQT